MSLNTATSQIPDVFKKLSPEVQEEFVRSMRGLVASILHEDPLLRAVAMTSVRSETLLSKLDELEKKTGWNKEDIITMSLFLYDVALDAMREKQRIAILSDDYKFVREITGLTPKDPGGLASEKSSA